MSIIMEIRKCPSCGKRYSWNPDVGKMKCPYCGGLKNPEKKGLFSGLGKQKEKNFPNV
ncbi:MAG: hypothetical protein J6J42_12885 [Lachnospiraceae bacterium]|nr:hypothetical protein [Lachnospiraceae bacterium]MBP3611216.1 hypothetical protein [Lachnospiraceae bacterium]